MSARLSGLASTHQASNPQTPMRTTYEVYPLGVDVPNAQPGDFILCHRKGLMSAIIRTGERIKFRSGSRWSHAAFVETSDTLIEALTGGVTRTPLAAYRNIEYVLVRTHLAPQDAAQAVKFAQSCLGNPYGYIDAIGLGLRFLIPGRGLWFGTIGTNICSGLVASTQVRGWKIYTVEPASISPAELAQEHGIPDRPEHLA